MRSFPWCAAGLLLAVLAGCDPTPTSPPAPGAEKPTPGGAPLNATGRTQSVPARRGIIAPVVLHPVVEVLVGPGDRVKKGQPLVKLDADEPEADVRARKAALAAAKVALEEAKLHLEAVEKGRPGGAVSEATHRVAKAGVQKAEADVHAAEAALEGSEAELEHYVVEAPIDGVVNWLNVSVGTVSRPGTTVWGEVLDLSEIDVRCDLPPADADRVAAGQAAEAEGAVGKVVFVGLEADRASGAVPVLVRLPNGSGRLRCGVPVQVRFPEAGRDKGGR
jgi:membrane fusion protein, multidrug efflux system